MAQTIINYEARRDARGRLQVYKLDPEDGGGRYEVAGINERYHKQLCDELVALIEAGQYAEAERRAVAFIADYTEGAAGWTSNPGVEFYLRDSMFNRGARGAAWILQEAVGAPIDQVVGPQTLAAVAREETRPSALLQNLRRAREAYERLKRDESSRYWRGLVNRWNNALAAAKSFLTSEGPRDQSVSSTNAGETSAPVFEPPPSNTEAGQPPSSPTGAPGEFQPPAVGERREDPAIAAPAVLATASAVDSGLIQMHRELEGHLFARPGASAFAAESAGPPDMKDLIVGVGIGPAHRDFESVGGAGPGAPVLNVYVAEPMQMDAVKAVLVDSFGVRPLASDDRPVNVIHTGPIDALGHRHPERPSPCGISVAHFKVTAGTQGALARGRSGPRQNRLLLLSNNHVLANANDCQAGDAILQPGWADFPFNLANQIAALEQWVPINYNAGGANFVDCATGWCWPDRVRKEFIYPRAGAWAYFSVDPQPVEAHLGLIVGKSGRTTQLTSGQVIDVNASLRVNYGAGRIANFRDQISIRGSSGSLFGRGGDSGSLIWTWHEKRSPIGLLFAGGGEFTFANKITHVLAALDIALFT
jgi:lysozyme family protein